MADLYVPLDVNAPDDPKILAAGDAAELVFYRSLCMAKRLQSDGFIAEAQVRRLGGSSETTEALTREGLWVPVDDGFDIPSFLKRNPSRATVEESRWTEAQRKKRWRQGQKDDATQPSGGTGASRPKGQSDRATSCEVKRSEVKELTREFDAWWSTYPRKVDKAKARDQFIKRRKDGVALETLEVARDAYAGQLNGTEQRFILLGATFLGDKGRWSDDWSESRVEDWMNPR